MLLASIVIAFIALIIGSITDLKNREVPDYVSYSLIFFAFASAIMYSIIQWSYIPIAQTAMGFIVGLIIAYTMFYLGQWGGGDSKLIMGLGAALGFNLFALFGEKNYWLLIFLFLTVIVGAVYGLFWSIALAIKHHREFRKALIALSHKKHILIIRRIALVLLIVFTIVTFFFVPQEFRLIIFSFIAVVFFMFYIWLFVKVIELGCMVKDVSVSKLTEGDWIYKNIKIGKKYLAGPKDLGISREQITLLKKYVKLGKIKKVTIKEGIPFIPAFLIAFILVLAFYYLKIVPFF